MNLLAVGLALVGILWGLLVLRDHGFIEQALLDDLRLPVVLVACAFGFGGSGSE